MKAPICPECGKPAAATTTRYGVRHDCCGLWSWGGSPLVDARTHEARSAAHEAFDPLWKDGLLGRREAYGLLANELGIPRDHCHMKLMDRETAEAVPGAVYAIRLGL